MGANGLPDTTSPTTQGDALRVVRAVKKITQTRLAKITGLSQSRIHLLEAGKATATPDEWARLWIALSS